MGTERLTPEREVGPSAVAAGVLPPRRSAFPEYNTGFINSNNTMAGYNSKPARSATSVGGRVRGHFLLPTWDERTVRNITIFVQKEGDPFKTSQISLRTDLRWAELGLLVSFLQDINSPGIFSQNITFFCAA